MSSVNPLSTLLADAHRHLAVGDASDDYLAELAAAFLWRPISIRLRCRHCSSWRTRSPN
jgi:hypothetical protein